MIKKANHIFILGIKGVAMANLTLILTKLGKKVFGWDVKEDFITKSVLAALPVKIFTDRNLGLDLVNKTNLIIYSAAHQGDKNPLLKKFSPLIPRIHQVKVIGEIMKQFSFPIAVAGSHGKTTVSSLLSYSLIKLNQKPSYLVGTSDFNKFYGADYQSRQRKYFIVEADEYGINPPFNLTPKFYYLNPKLIIATNIDFDHPDVYKNLADVKQAFLNFFNQKTIIACGDNNNLKETLSNNSQKQYLLYGFGRDNDYQIKNWSVNQINSQFDLYYKNKKIDRFQTQIFGQMNINNATSVVVALLNLGFETKKVKAAIEGFTGAKRRFEKIYQSHKTFLFDDYAHHPSEIKETIKAARLRFPKRRIVAIFQPHTYSRTQKLLKTFAQALSEADLSLVLPIFPSAREKMTSLHITSDDIVRFNKEKLIFVNNKSILEKKLRNLLKEGDIIFTMGAGDVYQLQEVIISSIRSLK